MPRKRSPRIVAVIGNGIIGHGIAEIFAMSRWQVRLVGRNAASLAAALGKIETSMASFEAHGLASAAQSKEALARIATTLRLDDAADAELVIEAVPEDMELKRDIFGRLDAICGRDAVLASSSGHLASELVARVRHPDRVIATHFWYPPQLIPLVEICAGPGTATEVVPRVCQILRDVGKEPVVIDKEIAGFIGNRIQFAALREAWALWAAGIASAEAIDAVVRNSFCKKYFTRKSFSGSSHNSKGNEFSSRSRGLARLSSNLAFSSALLWFGLLHFSSARLRPHQASGHSAPLLPLVRLQRHFECLECLELESPGLPKCRRRYRVPDARRTDRRCCGRSWRRFWMHQP